MTAAKRFLLWFSAALLLIAAAVGLHRYYVPLSTTQPIWWLWAVVETVVQCVAFAVGVMRWRELNLGLRVLTVLAGIIALHAVFGLCVAAGYYLMYGGTVLKLADIAGHPLPFGDGWQMPAHG